jgi:hypothetical protein
MWQHHVIMRTTLTLDDDVVARLKAAVKRENRPFRRVVNDALKAGLAVSVEPRTGRKVHRTTGFHPGASLVGALDEVGDVLVRVEGER